MALGRPSSDPAWLSGARVGSLGRRHITETPSSTWELSDSPAPWLRIHTISRSPAPSTGCSLRANQSLGWVRISWQSTARPFSVRSWAAAVNERPQRVSSSAPWRRPHTLEER